MHLIIFGCSETRYTQKIFRRNKASMNQTKRELLGGSYLPICWQCLSYGGLHLCSYSHIPCQQSHRSRLNRRSSSRILRLHYGEIRLDHCRLEDPRHWIFQSVFTNLKERTTRRLKTMPHNIPLETTYFATRELWGPAWPSEARPE